MRQMGWDPIMRHMPAPCGAAVAHGGDVAALLSKFAKGMGNASPTSCASSACNKLQFKTGRRQSFRDSLELV